VNRQANRRSGDGKSRTNSENRRQRKKVNRILCDLNLGGSSLPNIRPCGKATRWAFPDGVSDHHSFLIAFFFLHKLFDGVKKRSRLSRLASSLKSSKRRKAVAVYCIHGARIGGRRAAKNPFERPAGDPISCRISRLKSRHRIAFF
jgi:hypothetical protein